jgi:hypothetical protein
MKLIIFFLCIFLVSKNIHSQSYFYSFENTFSGWDTTGIDLQLGDTTITWSIHPSDEYSIDSSYSMQFYLENYNDAGKIWIQKPFIVQQQKDYIVNIDYKFASRDFGLANLWTIITGVYLSPPDSAHELIYQGYTGNGFNFDTGYVWLDKNYEFNINSDTSNNLWIVIGIWGNWEVPRTYYIDSLSINIEEGNTGSLSDETGFITDYCLYQNYPNPFNPVTIITYSIPYASNVTIKVFDILGNEIATLLDEEKYAGFYKLTWDAVSARGELPSGVYFCRMQAGNFVQIKKMLLLR